MKEIINKMISLKVKIPIHKKIFSKQKKSRQVRGNDKIVLHMRAPEDFCPKCLTDLLPAQRQWSKGWNGRMGKEECQWSRSI